MVFSYGRGRHFGFFLFCFDVFIFLWTGVLPACMSVYQKGKLDPLEPELQVVVCHHVGSGN